MKPNTTDWERDLQATDTEEIDDRSTEADVNTLRRTIELFLFFSFFYARLTTLDLRFLLWKKLAKLLPEIFQSARQKEITLSAAHFAESSLRRELVCGPLTEVLHHSWSWLNWTESAARCPARASCAGSKVGAEKFAIACNATRYVRWNCNIVHVCIAKMFIM